MQAILIKYISEELSNESLDEELTSEDDLLGSGILDSLGMVKLIAFIEEEFAINIEPEEMLIENFMTIGHITEFLSSK